LSWNIVDSSGWLEYLADGPNAGFFAKPLNDRPRLLVPSVIMYEVCKVLRLRQGSKAADDIAMSMHQAVAVPLTPELAYAASRLSVEKGLAMADAMIAATADAFDAVIWTQDADFVGLPRVNYKAKAK
jgi:predicted nucleic acid-binding protein